MYDVFQCVKRNLKQNGKAFLLYPQKRLAEAEKIAKKVDLKITSKFIMTTEKSEDKILFVLS
jgi:tRNA1(Val) A37 N6-methylase TrmN6